MYECFISARRRNFFKIFNIIILCMITGLILTSCAVNETQSKMPESQLSIDNELSSSSAQDGEMGSYVNDTNSGFESSYGLLYEEVEYHDNGLLVNPENGYEKTLDHQELEHQLGTELSMVLDAVLFPLKRCLDDTMVAFYEDGTVCWGTELTYRSPYDENIVVSVAFNADHQVVRGGYYVSENSNVDYTSNAFLSKPLLVSNSNYIKETAVMLGHSECYLGFDEQGEIKKADVLIASFRYNDTNYVVESVSLNETDFFRIVNSILAT